MTSQRQSRRDVLGAIGTALATGLAGCSTGGDGEGAPATGATATTTDDPSPATTGTGTGSGATGSTENASPYTRVYRETLQSVVLVRVSVEGGRTGQGTGFVFRDGYLVTNAHVVARATDVEVQFSSGEWRSASVVGTDASSDLAVLAVRNDPDDARPLEFAETQPPIGTEVVAIGSPYGLEGSVTAGLVSGVNRLIPAPNGYTIPDAIQTSAPVNPGNSGGPLVDLEGRAVGVINSGGGENLAFAISAALVERVVPALVETGEYEHAYMGVGLRTVSPRIAERAGLEHPRGVLVAEVRKDGPAAGVLRPGDVVVGIGGQRVERSQQLASYLALEASPGDTVTVTFLRDGERRTVELEVGTRPERPDVAR